jgi:hypothetical protein
MAASMAKMFIHKKYTLPRHFIMIFELFSKKNIMILEFFFFIFIILKYLPPPKINQREVKKKIYMLLENLYAVERKPLTGLQVVFQTILTCT